MKVIIAGGGIGGLAAAISLGQLGWSVTVLEQAKRIDAVGAGIQISPNGCHVLKALNVFDDVKAAAFMPEALEMRLGRSGLQVFNIPLQAHSLKRWGAEYLHVHRADLIAALLSRIEQLANVSINTGEQFVSYENRNNQVLVRCNRNEYQADILIGADGIHSAVRTQMHGEQKARYTGNIAWRAVVPADALGDLAPPPTACVWVGAKRHAVTYRLAGGALVNFVGVVEQNQWDSESWTERGELDELKSDFAGWHPILEKIIDSAGDVFRWGLFDREPLSNWNDGHVTLLGDACHPMLPFQAQGASCALEDAWVLSTQLSANGHIEDALASYFQLRTSRARKVQQAARANMRRFHHSNPLAYAHMFLAGRLAPGFVHSRQDWIYGHNVTANR